MTASLLNKNKKYLYAGADILFVLWLVTEVAFAHSRFAQVCMGLFMAFALGIALAEKKAYFSYWMPISLLVIVWGWVGAGSFALNKNAAMDTVKTLCVNFAFLFCMFQYLINRRDMKRVFVLYMAAAAAIAVYLLFRCLPMDLMDENSRLGMVPGQEGFEVIINPNWIGMLAAFSFAMGQFMFMEVFNGNRKGWKWLAAMVFFGLTVLLTKSTKAYGTVFIVCAALVLMRWPKKWGWKLFAIFAGALLIFYVVIARMDVLDHIFFHKLRYTIENLFVPGENDVSLDARNSLFDIGWQAVIKRPFTGYGLDGFRFLPGAPETYTHNNFLEMLVVGGVPMLLIYYTPYLLAVKKGFKAAKDSPIVRLTLVLTIIYIAMDFAQVTYVDRSMLLTLLLLIASTRLNGLQPREGEVLNRIGPYVKNPAKVVQQMSTRGGLRWMPDKLYLKLLYRGCTGKKLHLNPPVTMNEKLQWMKLYDHNPLYQTLADKLKVREYVMKKGCEETLIPLLGVWDRPEEIDYFRLPNRFVLKCTHDSGGVRICRDKAAFNRSEANGYLSKRLQKNYYTAGREWPYKGLKGRIMAEAFIGNEDGTPPDDMKFFCFDGRVQAILVCTNRHEKGADYYFFDRGFKLFPVNEKTRDAGPDFKYPKPARLDDMILLAETLSDGLPQVRVDLYEVNGQVFFGEMTLFDQSGFANDYVEGGDETMGSFFSIPEGL